MGLEALSGMEYPGRFIILGDAPEDHELDYARPFVVYGITGRSPSSQARRMVLEPLADGSPITTVQVKPTDETLLAEGDPELLIYPSIIARKDVVYVSNGNQTSSLLGDSDTFLSDLHRGLTRGWSFEPDEPNYTPRINGIITSEEAFLGTIVRDEHSGEPVRAYFEVPDAGFGEGRLLPTYAGPNQNPVPSFRSFPLAVSVTGDTPQALAQEVYDALGPADGGDDYRVAVVAGMNDEEHGWQFSIVNRHGDVAA